MEKYFKNYCSADTGKSYHKYLTFNPFKWLKERKHIKCGIGFQMTVGLHCSEDPSFGHHSDFSQNNLYFEISH